MPPRGPGLPDGPKLAAELPSGAAGLATLANEAAGLLVRTGGFRTADFRAKLDKHFPGLAPERPALWKRLGVTEPATIID